MFVILQIDYCTFNYSLIYVNIYNFYHNENDVLALTLDVDGNTAYKVSLDNKQWEDQQGCADVSKDDRDVLRLAAVLVFWSAAKKAIQWAGIATAGIGEEGNPGTSHQPYPLFHPTEENTWSGRLKEKKKVKKH